MGIKIHFSTNEVTLQYFPTLRTIMTIRNSELFLLLKGTVEARHIRAAHRADVIQHGMLIRKQIFSFKLKQKKITLFCEYHVMQMSTVQRVYVTVELMW